MVLTEFRLVGNLKAAPFTLNAHSKIKASTKLLSLSTLILTTHILFFRFLFVLCLVIRWFLLFSLESVCREIAIESLLHLRLFLLEVLAAWGMAQGNIPYVTCYYLTLSLSHTYTNASQYTMISDLSRWYS